VAKLAALNQSKYMLLKNEKDLNEEQVRKLKEIQEQIPELGAARAKRAAAPNL